MNKFLIFILFILLSFNPVLGDYISLPYTDSSNYTWIDQYNYIDTEYNITTQNDNEIYEITMYYSFSSIINVDEGIYIHNYTFMNNYVNTIISEKYNITDAFLSKKVNYELNVYENDILTSQKINSYYVFTTANNFAKSVYTFDTNEIIITNVISNLEGYLTKEYTLTLSQPLSLTQITINSTVPDKGIYTTGRKIYLEYIKTGEKPKSYYVKQLHPILQLPYRLISSWDNNNNVLNILLITSYILKSLFFWIKVLYTSMFTILIITLIAIIPFISLQQTNNRNDFINKLFYNYSLFFNMMINIVKYMINLIIKLIELIPFI